MGLTLHLYNLLAPLLWRQNLLVQPGDGGVARPAGPLVWLHAPIWADGELIAAFVRELSEQYPDVWVVVTGEGSAPVLAEVPDNCIVVPLPADTRQAAASFATRWSPDVVVWLSGNLRPAILHAVAARGAEIIMFDTGSAYSAARQFRLLAPLRVSSLRLFNSVVASDSSTEAALRKAGAHWDRIQTVGALEVTVDPPDCSHAERDTLGQVIGTRPVWLAAAVNPQEMEAVLAAHAQVLRRSHRLLLIVVPADPARADDFATLISGMGLVLARRSAGEEPEPDTQVYLADTSGELGLWYRLAPITFVGQTLAGSDAEGPHPFGPAALGSVVVHGPATAAHVLAYRRLARAGASIRVTHSGELAEAVETLLAPDRAAELAHAAWQVCSSGAEVQERAVEMVVAALDRRQEQS